MSEDKKSLHPETVYEILKKDFVAKGQEYGVDITSDFCQDFFTNLYAHCYLSLRKNIRDREEDDDKND